MVNLDRFSEINLLYGNAIGDLLLRAIATRIQIHCNPCSSYRFGGDTFALMVSDLHLMGQSVKKRIHYIEELLEDRPFEIGEHHIDIGVTIGVGVGSNALTQAMMALDIAKKEKKPYKIYSRRNRHIRKIQQNLDLHKRIQDALKNDRIIPFAQPIVDAKGHIHHHECLMRMLEPESDEILYWPSHFLESAKQAKLYLRLSRMTIQKAFELFADGRRFSINLSYVDIKEPTTRPFLEHLIMRYRAQGRVVFELLEHESLEDTKLVQNFLDVFRAYQVEIAIDDFGSRYSNLIEILRFKPDYLKIDGSLIRNMAYGNEAYIAVEGIVQSAHRLHASVIAEYVTDRSTFALCRDIGIDLFQGNYFSPAIPIPDAKSVEASGKRLPLS
jgi:diguanylate cyclase (GGDEF)-like protein